ncbi:D-alanine--D-alanine ligase [Bradyrhizobium sp. 23AC]
MTILNVALLFGGGPTEHDTSIWSARSVYEALERKRFNPILVGVARDGRWFLQEDTNEFPLQVDTSGAQLIFLPGGGGKALVHRCNQHDSICHVDVVFPISPYGHSRGIMETAPVAFVGSRGPAQTICSDKQITKRILRDAGLPVARSLVVIAQEQVTFRCVQEALCSRSLYVKPVSLHSSIGVSKVTCESDFQSALHLAFSYDSRVLLEEEVQGRELECAILQDAERPSELICSWPSEIIPTEHPFFTSQAKFDKKGVKISTKAELDEAEVDRVRALSREAFRVIGCEALARVDFFMRPNGELLINEVGPAPGLSSSSVYSMMMEESGIPYKILVQKLLEDAIKRSERARAVL